MPGLILAAVTPSNTPHGYNLTYAFPMLLFIVIAAVLYYLFGRPHRRVPRQPISLAAGRHQAGPGVAQATGTAPAGGAAEQAPGTTANGQSAPDTGAQE